MQPIARALFLFLAAPLMIQSCNGKDEDEDCGTFTVQIVDDGNGKLRATSFRTLTSYQWSTGANTPEITVDKSGIYSVTATSDDGCTTSVSLDYRHPSDCNYTTVTDADGNTYDVVKIGKQCWMEQNLKVTAGLQHVSDSMAWAAAVNTPAWCYYRNSSALGATYGRLYNWAAVKRGNLCPAGWHVPTAADWDSLITYLGGSAVAGGKMKSTLANWRMPNAGADNSSGFSALPGGYHNGDVSGIVFNALYEAANFWSSTVDPADTTLAQSVTVGYLNAVAFKMTNPKKYGYSCRCVGD